MRYFGDRSRARTSSTSSVGCIHSAIVNRIAGLGDGGQLALSADAPPARVDRLTTAGGPNARQGGALSR
jgi:hypothetical protein